MKTSALLSLCLFCGLMLAPFVHAKPPIHCDLRILELNQTQRTQIHARRQQFKTEQRRLARENHQPMTTSLRDFFQNTQFDNQQAGQIARQRHASTMHQTVAELSFYHDVFQLLTPQQREIWLKKCIHDRNHDEI